MNKDKLKSTLGSFLSVVLDLILLNVYWIVCALPVITAGPSTSAMFTCMLKIARDELGESTTKTFFRAFKENFKNSFWYGIIALAAAAIIYIDFTYALYQTGILRKVFFVVSGTLILIWLIYTSYIFALQARYENTFKNQIKNAFLLAFCAPGKTLMMWIIWAIPVALIFILPGEVLAYLGSIYLMVGASGPAYFNSKILRSVFDKFVKGDDNDKTASEEIS